MHSPAIDPATASYAALMLRLSLGLMFLAVISVVQALLGDGAYALRPTQGRLATA